MKLEKFQKPMSDFVFLSSLNCYLQTHLSFLVWWSSRTWMGVFSVFVSLRLKKKKNESLMGCLTPLPFFNLNGYNKPLVILRFVAGNILCLSLVILKNPLIFYCSSSWLKQLHFHKRSYFDNWHNLLSLMASNCSTCPDAAAGSTHTLPSSLSTKGV